MRHPSAALDGLHPRIARDPDSFSHEAGDGFPAMEPTLLLTCGPPFQAHIAVVEMGGHEGPCHATSLSAMLCERGHILRGGGGEGLAWHGTAVLPH